MERHIKSRKRINKIIIPYIIFAVVITTGACIVINRLNMIAICVGTVTMISIRYVSKYLTEQYEAITFYDDYFMIEDTNTSQFRNILYSEVVALQYSGMPFLPFYDRVTIMTINGRIDIDYGYYDYLSMWLKIYSHCQKENPDILISRRLSKRLLIDKSLV